ncbi:dTDP-4-dehydrorhamnose reductase (EC [Olavius algarvensis associated proteobacterium Delta 3]|nr:dTDP-4-dehydrorhamnose reductase (EC [Olavius algarvensis associated proteobacterium Delta 3]CAB5147185.1 dTDP-4-dehydrorhamnose reductase (EC [Olavius algarvensis associated proteobacterium Delta 3]
MKILLTGADGQLGREVVRQSRNSGIHVDATDLPDTDIGRADHVRRAVAEYQPELVINAAAYTAVDKAELETEIAFQVNAGGPRHLAEACGSSGIPMVHISTDYVFNGTRQTPYGENDPLTPIGVYGVSKAQGETFVREILDRHIIVRTSWLYGVYGHNFVKTMLRLGAQQEEIRVVADQRGCPTSAADLAAALLSMIHQIGTGGVSEWGTYHYCGKGETTWFHFAEAVFERARSHTSLAVTRVVPISTTAFGAPAPRPAFSVLSCERIRQRFGIAQRPWIDSLDDTITRIYTDQ